ncbi:MAG: LysM peptidoglycan-binding domain-containing protein [Candidatus Obscuribacterales bacterium]|nr:LysM peptidoglycan-binding domain-containing protein [Candidatus Obscuribacterales bacterium]
MVSDKFRPTDVRQPEPPKAEQLEKGQDVLKAEKKELKFSSHTIKSGETLSEICQQYGIPLKALYAVNQHELDPKIMLKDGKIAYGAPTYHVGDKLNIPSNADVPNAVKYFDQWAKALVAKQRLEQPESPTAGKPPGAVAEKKVSKTQMMDEEHLAAKRAAMMVKIALETQHNKFQSQHEGQGPIDDAIDWFKRSTGLEHSSDRIEKEYEQERQMIKLLEKSATLPNLNQFENLYRQCTGKNFNPTDFSSKYKKPASLAFPNLADNYEESQEAGRRAARSTAALPPATLAFLLGGGVIGATGAGAAGGGLVDYANTGRWDKTASGVKDGAITGLGVGLAGSVGLVAHARTAAVVGGEGILAKTAVGVAAGSAGGATAGGVIEGGFATRDDIEKKGYVDVPHVASKTVHGAVIGLATGGLVGGVAPAISEGAAMLKSASSSTASDLAAADAATAGATAADSAVASRTTDAFNKTSQLPKETPTPPTDSTKLVPPAKDVAKTPAPTEVGDAPKVAPQQPTDASKGTTQQGDTSKGATQGQQELPKGAPQADTTKGQTNTATDTSGADKWNQGSTHDVPLSQKPDVSKYVQKLPKPTPEESWQLELDQIHKNPQAANVRPIEGLQGKWTGVQYETKIGGRKIADTFNPENGSRVHTEDYSDGLGTIREVKTTPAGGKEVSNKFRVRTDADGNEKMIPLTDKWEGHLNQLKRDREVTNLEEVPFSEPTNDWTKIRYEKNGRQIEEANRTSDGARYRKEEYIDHRGVPNREVSTTSADGQTITNKFTLDQNNHWKFISKTGTGKITEAASPEAPPGQKPDMKMQFAKEKLVSGQKWLDDRIKCLKSDPQITQVTNGETKQGWKSIWYSEKGGAQVLEEYNPISGSKHIVREYSAIDPKSNKPVRFQEETMDVPKDGITHWRKLKEYKKLSTGLEENDQPQFEWFTEETKRVTITPSGTKRTESFNPSKDHRPVVSEEPAGS